MKEEVKEINGKRYMKVQKGKYYDKKSNRKMKRHHPVRWILISCLLLFVVAPVAFIFGAFYDTSTKQLNDTYEKFDNNLAKNIGEGFSKLSDTNHTFKMTLDNDFFDSLLVAANNTLQENPTASKFIKKIYCTMEGDRTKFYVDLQASFFKTRAVVDTTLKMEQRNNADTFVFTINNIGLGRLPLGGLAKSILPKFLSDEQINTAIKQVGINANFSLANMEITYPRANIKSDIGTILEKANIRMDSQIASIILGLFDDLNPSAYYNSGLTFSLDFSKMATPIVDIKHGIYEELEDKEKDYVDFCEAQLNAGNLVASSSSENDTSYNTVENMFNFLLKGEKPTEDINDLFINDSIKNDFNTTFSPEKYDTYKGNETLLANKCSEFGKAISDRTTYPKYIKSGVSTLSKEDLVTFAKNESKSEKLTDFCIIGDDLLSDYLRSTSVVGYSFPIILQTGEKTYDISMLTFDDLSVNLSKDKTSEVDLIGNLNMNSTSIPVTFKCDISAIETGGNRKIKFTPKNVYFGNIDIGDLVNKMFEFMKDFMSSGTIKIESETIGETTNYWFEFNLADVELDSSVSYSSIINNILKANTEIDLSDIGITDKKIDGSKINLSIDVDQPSSSTDKVSTLKLTFINSNEPI